MTKYFVDAVGNYLGGFDGAEPPKGAIEVATPPIDGRCKWDGLKWSDAPVDVPQKASRRAFRRALHDFGWLSDIEAIVAASNEVTMQMNWADATEFWRDNYEVIAMADLLEKTADDLDKLFIKTLEY